MKSVLFYFSSTGNGYSIAHNIREKFPETEIYSMGELSRRKGAIEESKDADYVGFVIPTYFQDTPDIVKNLMKRTELKEGAYIYGIVNANGLPSNTFKGAEKVLNKRGKRFNSMFYFDMPGNSIVFFDFSNAQKIRDYRLKMAEHHLEYIVPMIKEKMEYRDVVKGASSPFKSKIDKFMLKHFVKDKAFSVNENCTNCGMCEKYCPTKNISVKEQKVQWNGNCVHCWGCLNRCPRKAIENISTQGRPRYINPFLKPGQVI